MRNHWNRGFTLIELVVVIAIFAIAAGVLVPRMSNHMASSRDARRIADVNRVRGAIERYHADRGTYPAPNRNTSFGGWDVSHDGDFVRALSDGGYLEADFVDPVNDEMHHYRYYVYDQGAYGCVSEGPYYVLGIRAFESPEFAKKNEGFFRCANRDWGAEFAYVTGGGASFQ